MQASTTELQLPTDSQASMHPPGFAPGKRLVPRAGVRLTVAFAMMLSASSSHPARCLWVVPAVSTGVAVQHKVQLAPRVGLGDLAEEPRQLWVAAPGQAGVLDPGRRNLSSGSPEATTAMAPATFRRSAHSGQVRLGELSDPAGSPTREVVPGPSANGHANSTGGQDHIGLARPGFRTARVPERRILGRLPARTLCPWSEHHHESSLGEPDPPESSGNRVSPTSARAGHRFPARIARRHCPNGRRTTCPSSTSPCTSTAPGRRRPPAARSASSRRARSRSSARSRTPASADVDAAVAAARQGLRGSGRLVSMGRRPTRRRPGAARGGVPGPAGGVRPAGERAERHADQHLPADRDGLPGRPVAVLRRSSSGRVRWRSAGRACSG